MNKRQVTILWILAVALTATLVILKLTRSGQYEASTHRERGDTLLAGFLGEKVSEITIRKGEQSVMLTKSDGTWTIAERDDYPANVSRIHELLRGIGEVEITQGIGAEPSLAPRFGMDPKADPENLPVEAVFHNASGDQLARITLGKNLEAQSDPTSPLGGGGVTGRYVRNHADDSGFYVVGEVFPTLQPDPKAWLKKDFLQLEKIQSIAVSEPGEPDKTAWKVTRPDEAADFSLVGIAEDEKLDAGAVNPLKNLFSYASFQDVIPAEEAEEAWDEAQRRTATIATVEGFTYEITYGPQKSAAENGAASGSIDYLMTVSVDAEIPDQRKVEEGESEEEAKEKQQAFERRKKELEEKLTAAKKLEGRTYQVSKFTVDALLKSRDELLESEDQEAAANQPPANAPRDRIRATTPPISIPMPEPAADE